MAGQAIDIYKEDGDKPEEGEGIDLEIREEGEFDHLQEGLFFRFDIFVVKTCGKGRLL